MFRRHPRRLIGLAVVLAAACTTPSVRPGTISPPIAGTPATVTPTIESPIPSASGPQVATPAIFSKPIPFPDSRKSEMAAYAEHHYGIDSYRLERPQAIVEHFTGNESFPVVWDTFASNTPDLGELPGTCAHFVIDADGTIYQLVPLDLMCRHASGMNWTAIGIEMVATSDQEILGRPRQLSAALSLTLRLMARFGIELRNVIGHNENLMSPLRRELVAAFRCQTHGDWSHADMTIFRSKLAVLARRHGVPLGPPPAWIDIGC